MSDIETINDQAVAVNVDRILVLAPKRSMTKKEALRHAAWLVALADESDGNGKFCEVLDAVRNT